MHTEQYTDISIKISRLLLKITGIWKSANKTEDRQRKFAVFYTMITSAYSMYVNVADIYHNLNDLDRCIFLAANVLNTILVMFKISIINLYKTEFSHIIVYAQKHFWHLNYDLDEKILFAECKKVCKLWSLFIILVIQIIASFYAVAPICANIRSNSSERALPVAMWVDLPIYVTPYYEIMFVIQLATVQQICVAYMACDNFLCILNMHVICQFRILHNRLLNLWKIIDQQTDKVDYTDKCYAALKKCIRQHQSLIKFCERLEYVYKLPIFGHIVIFSLLMCFDTYEILLADVSPGTRLIFVFHMFGNFIHIIFFTYTCHGLMEESSNISLATYSGWWTTLPMTETGRMLREDVKIMIMKSTRPCYLTAGGFFPVSLETSTALMSTTMSYFTLIRESSLKMKNK
ncbi:odorant receptor 30a-like [Bombus pyrosoma]|uniref:odorant receptor 30a-like n=1 Tax=Bombus pyrosoma TaxID=396416 RepID=UPI001CB91E25|nr:odorant receptor 30a-like [Bombus pyrosoma]